MFPKLKRLKQKQELQKPKETVSTPIGISSSERKRMLHVPLVSQQLVHFLEKIGITQIKDLKGKLPKEVIQEINEKLGHNSLRGPMILMGINNLIDLANEN